MHNFGFALERELPRLQKCKGSWPVGPEGLCSEMLRIRPHFGKKGSALPRQSPSHGFAVTARCGEPGRGSDCPLTLSFTTATALRLPFTQGGLWLLPFSAIYVQFEFAHLEIFHQEIVFIEKIWRVVK